MFLSPTSTRVSRHTSPRLQRRMRQRLLGNLGRYRHAERAAIDQRLAALDREWNVERAIELEAPVMIGLGAALGLFHHRKWFALSGLAAGMVLLHNTRGWYPLLPLLQRLGMRSQRDIELERQALRVLRQDHHSYRHR